MIVRRLSPMLVWIVPEMEEDVRRFSIGGSHFADGPLKKLISGQKSWGPVW